MVELTFKVSGDKQLARNLRVLARDLGEIPSEFFKEALEIIGTRTDEIFASEGSVVQKANTWAPLAASTIKARTNRWGYYKRSPSNPSTMRWTGNLQQNRTLTITATKGTLVWNAPYAVYHQKPGTGGPPRRVIVDLSNPTNKLIIGSLQRLVNEKIGIFGRQA